MLFPFTVIKIVTKPKVKELLHPDRKFGNHGDNFQEL